MNPTPAIYILQSLHGHLPGFHLLIFCLKTIKVAADLISSGIIFQIFGPKLDKVALPAQFPWMVLLVAW